MYLIDPIIAKIWFFCAVAYTVLALLGFLMHSSETRRLFGIGIGATVSLFIYLVIEPFGELQSFGPSPLGLLIFMIIAIMLGSIAEYIFTLGRKKFRILNMVRPVLISPILLLPLLGLLQEAEHFDTLATVSLLLVAFQNGFFWRDMVEKAKGAI